MSKIFVPSEIAPLKTVIVHRPDAGISRISPKRSHELLFDDIVFLPDMQKEHDVFSDVLAAFIGREHVLETEDLIFEALINSEPGKEEILRHIAAFEELPAGFQQALEKLEPRALARTLISGYIEEEDFILFDPIPNFIFTRDIAVTVKDHIIIAKAAKDARFRENLLARFIFWYHPMFQEVRDSGKLINLNAVDKFPPSRKGESVSIEGGDMMILNEEYFLIGCSERSTAHAFHSLKNYLFEHDIIDQVVMVNIPPDRTFMHLDTVFTQIHEHHVVAYKPIVVDGLSSYVEVHIKSGSMRFYSSIREFIISEIDPSMEFILSGSGQSPYQEREQWTDGCNLLAVRPGVAITYDRNPHTERAFRTNGYSILHAYDFLEQASEDPDLPEKIENTIIALPSAELSRARGGSHCMSCPMFRQK